MKVLLTVLPVFMLTGCAVLTQFQPQHKAPSLKVCQQNGVLVADLASNPSTQYYRLPNGALCLR